MEQKKLITPQALKETIQAYDYNIQKQFELIGENEYIDLSKVELIESKPSGANVVIENQGEIQRLPISQIGGSGSSVSNEWITVNGSNIYQGDSNIKLTGEELYEKFKKGIPVRLLVSAGCCVATSIYQSGNRFTIYYVTSVAPCESVSIKDF